MKMLDEFLRNPRVAYFSMEIALRSEIPTYSGGLGILAGDSMRAAADLQLPMVAVSLISRKGYFQQVIDDNGRQSELPNEWQPADWCELLPAKVTVEIEGREVWVGGWLYTLTCEIGGRVPVILLDTDFSDNTPMDRELTHYLYGGDVVYRFKQEVVLGIAGERLLKALGFDIFQYHMNEGHSALLALELLNRYAFSEQDVRSDESIYDIQRVRSLCCFTTHTPVEAGHDRFGYDLVWRTIGDFIQSGTLKKLAGYEALNMTQLALNMSEQINGVAKRHADISRQMFPGYRINSITNGVHPLTWVCPELAELYNHALPGWCHEPELLRRADGCIDDAQLWKSHQLAKQRLIDHVKLAIDIQLNPALPIFGFARRMTAYKRPDLIFSDLERLKAIAGEYPFQIVLAGKAHPSDLEGKRLIEQIHVFKKELQDTIPVVFLVNYNMAIAQLLVAGADIWLNTPMKPLEASGTSGMKAAFNGVPQLSVLDGWWMEGCIEGQTGWAIGSGDEIANGNDGPILHQKLEQVVLPLYYKNHGAWIKLMKGAIAKNASFFSSHRMMRRYVSDAYIQ